MSVTLATMADALIDFILSLLRDPEAAAEFDEDPQGALASRGLSNVSAADVCSVAPVIADRPAVVPHHSADRSGDHSGGHHWTPKPVQPTKPEKHHDHDDDDPVVREIKSITNSMTWVDDRDTVVDQSVNQNIWADGDVTQVFDNEAIVASGDDSMAAGDDATVENTLDQSTDIEAGEDVNIGNETDTTVVEDSFNEETDASTETDSSVDVEVDDSLNDNSDTVAVDESFNDTTTEYTETEVEVDADVVFESTDTVIAEDVSADDNF